MKKIKPILVTLFLSIIIIDKVNSQEQRNYNLFDQNYIYFNPAKISFYDTEALLINRNSSLNNFNSNFVNIFLGINHKFQKVKGIFIFNYSFDQYSFFNQNTLSFGYSFPWAIGKKKEHILSFGVRLNAIINTIDYTKLTFKVFDYKREIQFRPDVDLGVFYFWKGLEIGVSVKHLTSPSLKYKNVVYIQNVLTTNLLASYKIKFKKSWFLKPQINIMRVDSWFFKPAIHFGINNLFEAGITFDYPFFHVGYNLGFYINKTIGIFGSFDHSLATSTKNFELMLKINLRKSLKK